MSKTRTGSFPIGIRQRGGWMATPGMIDFARKNDFGVVDVAPGTLEAIQAVTKAGLGIGSADLPQPWSDLASADKTKRRDAAQKQAQFVNDAAKLGVRNFFFVALPEEDGRPRDESFRYLADSLGLIAEAVKSADVRLCIEGWPGGAPLFPSIVCTPETYRALFRELPSPTLAVNYDPSHLVRMGIDPVRFLDEFMPRVGHVHAKDTEIRPDDLYTYGHLQQPTFLKTRKYGGTFWRYTIPGHGQCPWLDILSRLEAGGYRGAVSIELEDANFFGEEAAEQRGFVASRDFLRHT